jgi:alpha-tubulin suppressor-like RCC1 family protein
LGNAFGIGYSHHGEVGAATTGQFETWTPCALNSTRTRIKEASSGLFHTVYLPSNETDCVYVTGRNNEAQCLQPTTFKVEITKVMVQNVCKAIATTYTTFIILSMDILII